MRTQGNLHSFRASAPMIGDVEEIRPKLQIEHGLS
jgi:hypothetical protein